MVNFLRQVITFTLMWLIFKEILTVGQLISLQFYSFFIFGPLQEIGSIILSEIKDCGFNMLSQFDLVSYDKPFQYIYVLYKPAN